MVPSRHFFFISYVGNNKNPQITDEIYWSLDVRYCGASLYIHPPCLQVGDAGHVECLEHVLGVGIDFEDVLLVDVRHFRNVVVTTFTLFLLQLDGDT